MSSIIIEQHRNMGHGREKAHTNDHRGIVDLYTAEKHDSKHRLKTSKHPYLIGLVTKVILFTSTPPGTATL